MPCFNADLAPMLSTAFSVIAPAGALPGGARPRGVLQLPLRQTFADDARRYEHKQFAA
jgi:hypothetical protein